MFVSRTQADSVEDFARYSDEAVVVCTAEEDRTRQEFAAEADINVILRRFGAGGFEPRPVRFGVQDFNDDLQGVMIAAREAQDAFERLPEKLRRRYPSWNELLPALETGEATLVDKDGVEVVPPKAAEVSPARVVP